jgi:hypothetical protein
MIINKNNMNFKLLFSLVFVSLSWLAQAQKNYVKEANDIYRNENFCEGAVKKLAVNYKQFFESQIP